MSEARQETTPEAVEVDPNAIDPAAPEGGDERPEAADAAPEPAPKPDAGQFTPLERRMFELRSKAREAEARAAAAERALSAIETSRQPEPKPEPAPVDMPRPDRGQFDTPEEYEAAITEWASERAINRAMAQFQRQDAERRQQQEREAAEARAREEAQKIGEEWEKRRAAFTEQMPDYAEVAESDDIPVSEAMGRAILTAENGPEIAYYLGKNPDEARRIAAMVTPGVTYPRGHEFAGFPVPDFQKQFFEMGKLSAKLASESAAVVKKPSNAPRPITPVRPSGSPGRKTLAELAEDPDAYARDFAERQRQKAAGR